MSTGARVENIEALKLFKANLLKFSEKISVALDDAETEMQRTLNWLENEQPNYWIGQIRKRHEAVERAKEALRSKRLFKDSSGRTPTAVDEEHALAAAKRRLEEAEQKSVATKQWARRLQKELLLYKGQVTRLVVACSTDIPAAVAQLNNIVSTLEQYIAAAPAEVVSAAPSANAAGQMARGGVAGGAVASSPFASLRRLTPQALDRNAAQIREVPDTPWQSGAVLKHDRIALAALGLPPMPVTPAERIICAAEVWVADSIYCERLAPLPDGATWYIGPTVPPANVLPCVALRAEDLLRRRPDLTGLLSLPEGFLAVIAVGGGLQAVLNPQDCDLLQNPAFGAGMASALS
jgi:hypothetical protein